jgi:hypothetical protein
VPIGVNRENQQGEPNKKEANPSGSWHRLAEYEDSDAKLQDRRDVLKNAERRE